MANITLLDLARQGKLGAFKDPQAAVDNYYKTNPLMVGAPEEVAVQSVLYPNAPPKPSTPTDTGAIGLKDILRGPAIMADGSGRNIPIGDTAHNGQLVQNRSGNPEAPAAVYKSEQEQIPQAAAPREMTKADLQAQQASWTRTLPEHLKPKIEKDKDGNEIVTIQGSLLNKIMRDMYSAGEENYQLQNMPEPVEPGIPVDQQRLNYAAGMTDPATRTPQNDQRVAAGQVPVQQQPVQTPYDSRVSIPNPSAADPYASSIIRELQNAYPQRSLEEILKLLRGG